MWLVVRVTPRVGGGARNAAGLDGDQSLSGHHLTLIALLWVSKLVFKWRWWQRCSLAPWAASFCLVLYSGCLFPWHLLQLNFLFLGNL